MDTPDDLRYFVATDHAGSPVAVFEERTGELVKKLSRNPFGGAISDSNPALTLPLGFMGGIVDQYTHLIHFGDRVYDSLLGQWMTPNWEHLSKENSMRSPFDVFTYRFQNNNPLRRVGEREEEAPFMTGE